MDRRLRQSGSSMEDKLKLYITHGQSALKKDRATIVARQAYQHAIASSQIADIITDDYITEVANTFCGEEYQPSMCSMLAIHQPGHTCFFNSVMTILSKIPYMFNKLSLPNKLFVLKVRRRGYERIDQSSYKGEEKMKEIIEQKRSELPLIPKHVVSRYSYDSSLLKNNADHTVTIRDFGKPANLLQIFIGYPYTFNPVHSTRLMVQALKRMLQMSSQNFFVLHLKDVSLDDVLKYLIEVKGESQIVGGTFQTIKNNEERHSVAFTMCNGRVLLCSWGKCNTDVVRSLLSQKGHEVVYELIILTETNDNIEAFKKQEKESVAQRMIVARNPGTIRHQLAVKVHKKGKKKEALQMAPGLIAEALYFGNKGFEMNRKRALEFAQKATEQGDAIGFYILGCANYWGEDVPKNHAKALQYFKEALKHNLSTKDNSAQYKIGLMHLTGEHGIEQNYKEAMDWFKKSVDQNDKSSDWCAFEIGKMYHDGKGVDKNVETARKWYQKSTELRKEENPCKKGTLEYILCLLYGLGGKTDTQQGTKLLKAILPILNDKDMLRLKEIFHERESGLYRNLISDLTKRSE